MLTAFDGTIKQARIAGKYEWNDCRSNQKRRCKTTTTANLGIGLAREGKKVLLVDSDPQGSLSISLGHPQPDELPVTLATMMKKIILDTPINPQEGIRRHEANIDLMPANIDGSGLEVSLVNAMSRKKTLKQYPDSVKRNDDHVLPDCMPSLGIYTKAYRVCFHLEACPIFVLDFIAYACYNPIKFVVQRVAGRLL